MYLSALLYPDIPSPVIYLLSLNPTHALCLLVLVAGAGNYLHSFILVLLGLATWEHRVWMECVRWGEEAFLSSC